MKKILERGRRKIIIVIASFVVLVGGMFLIEFQRKMMLATIIDVPDISGINKTLVKLEYAADDYAEITIGQGNVGNVSPLVINTGANSFTAISSVDNVDISQYVNNLGRIPVKFNISDTGAISSGAALKVTNKSTGLAYCIFPPGKTSIEPKTPGGSWVSIRALSWGYEGDQSCWFDTQETVPNQSREYLGSMDRWGMLRFFGRATKSTPAVVGVAGVEVYYSNSPLPTATIKDLHVGTTNAGGYIIFNDNMLNWLINPSNPQATSHFDCAYKDVDHGVVECKNVFMTAFSDPQDWRIRFSHPDYEDFILSYGGNQGFWNMDSLTAEKNVAWNADLTEGSGSPTLSPSPQNIVVGQAPENMTASGGTSPYTFSFSAGGTGITGCSGASCTFGGTATQTGTATVTVTDSEGKTGTGTIMVSDSSGGPSFAPSTQTIRPGGSPSSLAFSGAAGVTYDFTFTDGGTGISLAGGCSDGVKASDTCTFTSASASVPSGKKAIMSVRGSDGKTASAEIIIQATGILLESNQNITAGITPTALTVSGGDPDSNYTYTLTDSGTGITKNACSGGVGATTCSLNASTGPGSLVVKVDDTVGGGTASVTITVTAGSLTVLPSSTINIIAGETPPQVTISGGTGYTFSFSDGGTEISVSGGCTNNSAGTQTCDFSKAIKPGTAKLSIADKGGGSATVTINVGSSVITVVPPAQEIELDVTPPADITVSGGTRYTFNFDDGGTGMTMSGCANGSAGTVVCKFTKPTAVGVAKLSVTDAGGGSGEGIITVIPRPNTLRITKTADVTEVVAGESVSYTITYENIGTAPYTNVTIADDYDENLMEIIAVPAGCSNSAGIMTCNIGTLAGGGSGTISYTARARDIG